MNELLNLTPEEVADLVLMVRFGYGEPKVGDSTSVRLTHTLFLVYLDHPDHAPVSMAPKTLASSLKSMMSAHLWTRYSRALVTSGVEAEASTVVVGTNRN
ncbi:unnamed protein product [Absidia cylindrospora]